MILYRDTDGRLYTRRPTDPFYTDAEKGERFYPDAEGRPVRADGSVVEGEIVKKFVYTFDEYVTLYPEAEDYRAWLTSKQERPGNRVVILQGLPGWGCHAGHMMNVTLYRAFTHPTHPQYSTPPTVLLNDGDDRYARKTFATDEEAEAGLAELIELAPFHPGELKDFGYNME